MAKKETPVFTSEQFTNLKKLDKYQKYYLTRKYPTERKTVEEWVTIVKKEASK